MHSFSNRLWASFLLVLFVATPVCLAQDEGNWTPERLFDASRTGSLKLVKAAIESGIDVNSKTEYGATALFFACDRGHEEIVKWLLDQGADPNVIDTFYDATPMTWARSKSHFKIVGMLLANGGEGADDMLMTAVSGVDENLTKIILDSGAVTPEGLRRAKKVVDKKGNPKLLALFDGLAVDFENEPEIDAPPKDDSPKASEMRKTNKTPEAKQPNTDTDPEPVEWKPSSEASRTADRAVSSANWPAYRGSGARGIGDGQAPPIEWNVEENTNLLWKTPVAGLGLSSPVIWENKLFITSAVSENEEGSLRIGLYGDVASVEEDNEYEFQLLCMDKTTGEVLWEQTANKQKPAVKRHAKSSHANPTPATDGKHVIAFFGSEGLYCYNMNGELLWERDLGFLDSGWFYDPGYQWGFGSSPIIFNDLVIVQCDIQKESFVAAFNVDDGEEVWRTAREEIPGWSSPTVHEFEGLPMLITGGTKAARGYDARTGDLLWSLGEHSEIVVPTPFVAHDLIFLASGYRPVQPIYAVRPDSRGDISLEGDSLTSSNITWSVKKGGPYMATPIVYGDYLYCCSNRGILTCYHALTGDQVYKQRLRAPGGSLAFTASPVASDGHLYLANEDGRVLVVKAGPEFELVATNETGESILATPAISAGAIYLRTQDSMIAVSKKNEE